MKQNKVFKGLFAGSFLTSIGMALNIFIVKANSSLSCNNWFIPVRDKTAKFYLLTDIIPTPIKNYFISFGDVLILVGIVTILYFLFKSREVEK